MSKYNLIVNVTAKSGSYVTEIVPSNTKFSLLPQSSQWHTNLRVVHDRILINRRFPPSYFIPGEEMVNFDPFTTSIDPNLFSYRMKYREHR